MDFIKSQYASENDYQNSIIETIGINFQIFEQLESQFGKPFNKIATVDFSFVSDASEKLNRLSSILQLKYSCIESNQEQVDVGIILKSWLIKEKQVEIQKINEWVSQLLQLGQENDCLFNGWGIFPESLK